MTAPTTNNKQNSGGWPSLILGFLMLLVGCIYLSEYQEHGWIYSHKYERIIAHGRLAQFICYLFFTVGGAFTFFGLKQMFSKGKPNQSLEADD